MSEQPSNNSMPATAKWALWLPLAIFAAFVVLALVKFRFADSGDNEVRSGMVGKPLPEFALPAAVPDRPGLARADFAKGKPRLLNVFGSWCIPCAVESPQLAQLKAAGAEIDGIAIRDRSEDVAKFLGKYGNPFTRIGKDDVSAVQLALGSSGVPETFVVDGKGVIRHQHIGDIRAEDVPGLLKKLKEAGQ